MKSKGKAKSEELKMNKWCSASKSIKARENHLLRKIRIENAANIEHCAMNTNLCIHGKDIVDGSYQRGYRDSTLEYPLNQHFCDPSSVYFAGANYW
ncbi:hypothetical protein VNO80_29248 [Phaseolus coccineus]|uniref:Uncharacterized protein n=1 Tax=Phaseolus coccineus TaxID=3886 RepID=A0AAN9QET8_PHACN